MSGAPVDSPVAPVRLTRSQLAVLDKLSRNPSGLRGRDFADLATVTHGKWEWGNPVLRALEKMRFVRRSDVRIQGVRTWVITAEGRDALPRAEVARAIVKADAPLTPAMLARLKVIADAHPWPFEAACGRATETSLEARKLVSVRATSPGWRDLRLTEVGIRRCNDLFALDLTMPEDPGEYSFDA
jgi:DNA-binding MarR family transcriptional regulator